MTGLPVLSTALDFDQAACLVLDYLREHVPIATWAVSRVENGRQTYLHVNEDDGYGMTRGFEVAWEDTFCIHMAAGTAPACAPDAQAVPLYAAAKGNEVAAVGAYAGAVVSEPDGSLFGVICGFDPKVRTDDAAFTAAGPLLQLLAQLLSIVLAANRTRDRAARDVALARVEADTDALTGLLNRRAWERAIAEEGERFQRLGDPTVVAMLDLDRLKSINDEQGHDAGDAYIRSAAAALTAAVRSGDVVARLGGDEFGFLMAGCSEADALRRVERLYGHLSEAGVAGSVGWAPISILHGFPAALADADEAMYAAKRARRVRRSAGPVPGPRERAESVQLPG